jgi:hypothetical protein
MEEGYSVESCFGPSFQIRWFRGKPEFLRFPQVLVPRKKAAWYSMSWNLDGLPVTIWRCQKCGYLEHYADGRSEES